MSDTRWYKVLVGGKSCHGGALTWSLPKDGQPGDWHEVDGDVRTCSRGLHLTSDPAKWFDKPDCTVYLAEGEGAAAADGDKVAFRRARLIRELTADDLVDVYIFVDRNGTVPGGKVGVAWGSSSVEARGSSSVVARGSSSVVARDSSSVVARDSSSVEARDSSSVVARDSSSVEARDSSSVVAWDSSSVVARDSSSVEARDSSSVVARDSSSVEARDSSSVVAWDSSSVEARGSSSVVGSESAIISKPHVGCNCCKSKATVTLTGAAVLVDQTEAAPKVTTATGELVVASTKKPKAAKKKPAKRTTKKVRK